MLILAKQGIREIYRLIHPNALLPIKIHNRTVPERVVSTGPFRRLFSHILFDGAVSLGHRMDLPLLGRPPPPPQ